MNFSSKYPGKNGKSKLMETNRILPTEIFGLWRKLLTRWHKRPILSIPSFSNRTCIARLKLATFFTSISGRNPRKVVMKACSPISTTSLKYLQNKNQKKISLFKPKRILVSCSPPLHFSLNVLPFWTIIREEKMLNKSSALSWNNQPTRRTKYSRSPKTTPATGTTCDPTMIIAHPKNDNSFINNGEWATRKSKNLLL